MILLAVVIPLWRCAVVAGEDALLDAPTPSVATFNEYINRTVLSDGWAGSLSDGSLTWPGIDRPAGFHVANQLVSPSEAAAIKAALQGQQFDRDPDTVDGETSFEYYLERNGGIMETLTNVPLKPDAYSPETLRARAVVRAELQGITAPIVANRVLPLVNLLYPECKGDCTVCHSLVRRYLRDERRQHGLHFDIQAFVTVVVSLTAFGNDFLGGLYVATADDANHSFVALQTGDAVVHQSDLLHGVDVISGDRYSWVLWLKDSKGCGSSPADWQRQAAENGDPVASFLQAHRAHMQPGISPAAAAVKKFKWLRAAAIGGFSRAQNEIGVAYMHGDGVAADLQTAKMWLRRASKFEPDALFNRGLLLLQTSSSPNKLAEAVALFVEAAEAGSHSAMFNLGVAYFKGRGVNVDLDLAEHWFTKEGSAEASYSIAQMYEQATATREADMTLASMWMERAARGGEARACMQILQATKDLTEAEHAVLLRCAADRGDTQAQLLLATETPKAAPKHREL